MAEIMVTVLGISSGEEPELAARLSDIFGAPAETDEAMGGLEEAVSGLGTVAIAFLIEVAKPLGAEIGRRLVELIRQRPGLQMELDVGGKRMLVDRATSPDHIFTILQQKTGQQSWAG